MSRNVMNKAKAQALAAKMVNQKSSAYSGAHTVQLVAGKKLSHVAIDKVLNEFWEQATLSPKYTAFEKIYIEDKLNEQAMEGLGI